MKKNKKAFASKLFSFVVLVFVVAGVSFYLSGQNKREDRSNKSADSKSVRQPRSLDKANPTANSDGRITKSPERKTASIPKNNEGKDRSEEKMWRQRLAANLNSALSPLKAEASVKELGQKRIKKGNKNLDAQHVLISIEKTNGMRSSYEALVHPKTGSMLHTWNQTRYEIRTPPTLRLKPLKGVR